jgi:hypothetical protein
MISFLGGIAATYSALLAWALVAQPVWLRYELDGAWLWLALIIVIIPVCCAWVAAELVNLASPRRIFDRRLGRWRSRLFLGLIAGTLGVAIGAVVLALPGVDRAVPDAVPLGVAAVLATILTMLPLSRRRAGHCIYCGYDLRSSPGPGRPGSGMCPECGAAAT